MTKKTQTETLSFQAEVKDLLHLVTHSLYSNKEIFLRELISNSSDALDKLRFEAIANPDLFESASDLKIWVEFDEKAKTITVRDNGIGMSRDEVVENLGTIAKSGTRAFLESMTSAQAKDAKLIGQFGVGFYSSFIVSDKVTVRTRRAGLQTDEGVEWISDGTGEYTITPITKEQRGTEVILHLKKDETDFLNSWKLRSIITKYSDHILFPIVMKQEIYPETEEGKEEPKEPEIKEEIVNSAKALWTLPKKEIKDEEYKGLYKHISHDFEDPMLWSHNKVEGKLEYTTLLYIPAHAPFDLWNREQQHGLKLFVQHVFIMDDTKQLLPFYLRFIRGIVDSNDLPLNVSRELLQSSKVMESIRGGVINRVLEMLEKLAKSDPAEYQKFWNNFGAVMKEGIGEDFANKDRITKLLRFASTSLDSSEQTVSLEEYVKRMQEGQSKIYYITADTFTAAKNSPHLEAFRKKGIEVLLLSDRVDEWLVANLHEYEGKHLQSVAKGELDIVKPEEKPEEEKAKTKEEYASIIDHVKKVLGDKVQDVRITDRLVDSPTCLVVSDTGFSTHLQRLMQEAGQSLPITKPILELNPEHVLIKNLKNEQDDERFAKWVDVLFNQAVLAEGGKLEDPATFVKEFNGLILELLK
jgi:molecular chaperone HtpG